MRPGRVIENRVKKELEEDGWLVIVPIRVRYHPEDFFGLFDAICIKKGQVRLIQTSTHYLSQRDKEWQERWNNFPHSREYWRWNSKKKIFHKYVWT